MGWDVIVVGAGLVGAACARALQDAGFQVLVLEESTLGGGATAAGMGHVVVMDDSEAQFALTHFSRDLWENLSLPADAEQEQPGTLWVASDDEEMAGAAAKQCFYQDRGVHARMVTARQLEQLEPHLRSGLAGGLLVPGDRVVYPPRVAAHLLARIPMRKARVEQVLDHGVLLEGGLVLQATHVVLAAGVQSLRLLPELPMRPRKGHLAITDRMPGLLNHQLVELGYLKSAHGSDQDSVAFNVQPRKTGQVLIGSSRQFDDPDPKVNFDLLGKMLQRAVDFMPELKHSLITRVWTGQRAATPDSLPLIGPHPARAGLVLATGHEGLGITTSLGTAKLVQSLLTGEAPPIDPTPYLPTREVHAHA